MKLSEVASPSFTDRDQKQLDFLRYRRNISYEKLTKLIINSGCLLTRITGLKYNKVVISPVPYLWRDAALSQQFPKAVTTPDISVTEITLFFPKSVSPNPIEHRIITLCKQITDIEDRIGILTAKAYGTDPSKDA